MTKSNDEKREHIHHVLRTVLLLENKITIMIIAEYTTLAGNLVWKGKLKLTNKKGVLY